MPRQELHTSALRKKKAPSRRKTGIERFGTPRIEPIYDTPAIPEQVPGPSARQRLRMANAEKTLKPRRTHAKESPAIRAGEEARTAGRSREPVSQSRYAPQVGAPTVFERLRGAERFTSQEQIAQERQKHDIVQSQIQLAPPTHERQLAGARKKKRMDGILEGFVHSMRLFVQRLIAMLKPQARMSAKGRAALAQLMQLYHLMLAQSGDGMDLVELKFAFGQAYFDVMQAAKSNHVRKARADDEDYSEHFVRFLRELDS